MSGASGSAVWRSDLNQPPAPSVVTQDPEGLSDLIDEQGYQTLARGFLSPRQLRLCQLAAQGKTNAEIAEALSYTPARVSILLRDTYIIGEITRLREKIFEESIGSRLKDMGDLSLNTLRAVLNDHSGRVKTSEKISVAQWILEKIDGKAIQRIDAGENLLAALMDRLDAVRVSGPSIGSVNITQNILNQGGAPQARLSSPSDLVQEARNAAPPSEEERLTRWVDEFSLD